MEAQKHLNCLHNMFPVNHLGDHRTRDWRVQPKVSSVEDILVGLGSNLKYFPHFAIMLHFVLLHKTCWTLCCNVTNMRKRHPVVFFPNQFWSKHNWKRALLLDWPRRSNWYQLPPQFLFVSRKSLHSHGLISCYFLSFIACWTMTEQSTPVSLSQDNLTEVDESRFTAGVIKNWYLIKIRKPIRWYQRSERLKWLNLLRKG